ncbi:MAG: hypothetical protein R2738_01270 [Bacteroides graminisolvens]
MNFLKNIAFFNAQGNRALFSLTRKNIYSSANYFEQIKKEISNYHHKEQASTPRYFVSGA